MTRRLYALEPPRHFLPPAFGLGVATSGQSVDRIAASVTPGTPRQLSTGWRILAICLPLILHQRHRLHRRRTGVARLASLRLRRAAGCIAACPGYPVVPGASAPDVLLGWRRGLRLRLIRRRGPLRDPACSLSGASESLQRFC
jgi:hypothetical protein